MSDQLRDEQAIFRLRIAQVESTVLQRLGVSDRCRYQADCAKSGVLQKTAQNGRCQRRGPQALFVAESGQASLLVVLDVQSLEDPEQTQSAAVRNFSSSDTKALSIFVPKSGL